MCSFIKYACGIFVVKVAKFDTLLCAICGQVTYSVELQEDLQASALLMNPTISISDTGQVPENRSSKIIAHQQCVYKQACV